MKISDLFDRFIIESVASFLWNNISISSAGKFLKLVGWYGRESERDRACVIRSGWG